jgi:hypothetical protein
MKYVSSLAYAALMLTCPLVHAQGTANDTNDEEAIRAVEQKLVHAISTNDRATMDQVLDSNFVDTDWSGVRRSKIDVLALPPVPVGSTQTQDDLRVSLYGDTAVMTGINRYRISPTHQPVAYAFTDVFVRRDGQWRLVSSSVTPRRASK